MDILRSKYYCPHLFVLKLRLIEEAKLCFPPFARVSNGTNHINFVSLFYKDVVSTQQTLIPFPVQRHRRSVRDGLARDFFTSKKRLDLKALI